MICFPNAKINLGLNILRKRPDGYRDISSCFYPIGLCDALEAIPASADSFKARGQQINEHEENLVTRAKNLIARDYPLPPLAVFLLKSIPIGAGLGGGSSDAAFMIKMLSDMFDLDIPIEQQENYARQLGSDCAFFIRNQPVYCYGRGDQFEEVGLSLKGYHLVLVNPGIHISTAQAYAGVKPSVPEQDLRDLISRPVSEWKNYVRNDFEDSVFPLYPEISRLKDTLYQLGAVYASMSGSGSSVYGIFKNAPKIDNNFKTCFVWQGELS